MIPSEIYEYLNKAFMSLNDLMAKEPMPKNLDDKVSQRAELLLAAFQHVHKAQVELRKLVDLQPTVVEIETDGGDYVHVDFMRAP